MTTMTGVTDTGIRTTVLTCDAVGHRTHHIITRVDATPEDVHAEAVAAGWTEAPNSRGDLLWTCPGCSERRDSAEAAYADAALHMTGGDDIRRLALATVYMWADGGMDIDAVGTARDEARLAYDAATQASLAVARLAVAGGMSQSEAATRTRVDRMHLHRSIVAAAEAGASND